jgi:hypothetical protein
MVDARDLKSLASILSDGQKANSYGYILGEREPEGLDSLP